MSETSTLSSAALLQQRLWGADPEAWRLHSEPHTAPLFEAALAAASIVPGTRLLDIACGTGMLLALAAERGARVTGLDVSPGMLQLAAEQAPSAELVLADLQSLPFADETFDVVTGINAFVFAEDSRRAITEAARVLAPGGRLVVGMFAEPERSQSTAIHDAMTELSPPERAAEHEPYALSAPGNLEVALEAAGLQLVGAAEVELDWYYEEVEHAVLGLSTSGGGTRAVEDVGIDAVRSTIRTALVPFTDATTGTVTLHNTFRWVGALKPPAGLDELDHRTAAGLDELDHRTAAGLDELDHRTAAGLDELDHR
ncbi:MAG: methyltransferase domain-containing protein, partial [Actinomycetota bacterium]|nr:methyltransferase domain-containing protein [Actinomycetota bacterium]